MSSISGPIKGQSALSLCRTIPSVLICQQGTKDLNYVTLIPHPKWLHILGKPVSNRKLPSWTFSQVCVHQTTHSCQSPSSKTEPIFNTNTAVTQTVLEQQSQETHTFAYRRMNRISVSFESLNCPFKKNVYCILVLGLCSPRWTQNWDSLFKKQQKTKQLSFWDDSWDFANKKAQVFS